MRRLRLPTRDFARNVSAPRPTHPWLVTRTKGYSLELSEMISALATRNVLDLLDGVCARRSVTREQVCGRGRTKPVALARHELWWLLRNHATESFTYEEIGRIFGRNHSSILHGVRGYPKRARVLGAPLARTRPREAVGVRAA